MKEVLAPCTKSEVKGLFKLHGVSLKSWLGLEHKCNIIQLAAENVDDKNIGFQLIFHPGTAVMADEDQLCGDILQGVRVYSPEQRRRYRDSAGRVKLGFVAIDFDIQLSFQLERTLCRQSYWNRLIATDTMTNNLRGHPRKFRETSLFVHGANTSVYIRLGFWELLGPTLSLSTENCA